MRYIEFDEKRKFGIAPVGRVTVDSSPTGTHKLLSESRNLNKYLGGSPANTVVGLIRSGKRVGFIEKVSDDRLGESVVDYFKKEGIDASETSKVRNSESSGLTFIEILSPTESSILIYRNGIADLQSDVDDISEDYVKNTKAIVISGAALAMSPLREAILKALRLVRKNGTAVIFGVDYRKYNWKNKDEMAVCYSIVGEESDIIMGSREEFDLMEGLIVKDSADEETAKRWLDYGNEIAVIKHGKDGSMTYTRGREAYRIKPFPVKLLKSFGGGDAYTSTFIYGILEGWDMTDTPGFGNASVAMLVANHSCSEGMPTVKATKGFIKEEEEEYGEMVARS